MNKSISKAINIILVAAIAYLAYQKFVINKPEKHIELAEIELTDIHGNDLNWEEVEGKAVFLNFWASWCRPCLLEMPSITKLYNQYKNDNIAFIIANTENSLAVQDFEQKKQTGLPHFVVRSTGKHPIKSIPLTYLIDKNGEVKKVVNRAKNWNSAQSKILIEQLINGNEK